MQGFSSKNDCPVGIDNLLILTFTKAAASEMKERIRKKIKEAGLFSELDKIDSAYINRCLNLKSTFTTYFEQMMSEGLALEDCVSTIAATLPICSVRGVAYSTFTIIHIIRNYYAEIIQFDNPHVILIRDYKN